MPESFPRTNIVPNQSPLFWVSHKDRYLRQLLISDIESETGRDLIVYFTDTDNSLAIIDPGDDQFLYELLRDRHHDGIDLLLETPGGATDTTEKLCAMLRSMAPDIRVVVPRRAKSNGTLMALSSKEILMSATSELGPIDPSLGNLPAEFILNDPTANPILKQAAYTAALQTKRLAKDLLNSGMMQGVDEKIIDETVEVLASRQRFHSHGSVVDAREAEKLGLKVNFFEHSDPLWQKFWLLRSMYAYDAPRNGHAKIFEGLRVSTAVAAK
jgi:hypothetical protein